MALQVGNEVGQVSTVLGTGVLVLGVLCTVLSPLTTTLPSAGCGVNIRKAGTLGQKCCEQCTGERGVVGQALRLDLNDEVQGESLLHGDQKDSKPFALLGGDVLSCRTQFSRPLPPLGTCASFPFSRLQQGPSPSAVVPGASVAPQVSSRSLTSRCAWEVGASQPWQQHLPRALRAWCSVHLQLRGRLCVWDSQMTTGTGAAWGSLGCTTTNGASLCATAHADGPEGVLDGPENAGMGGKVSTHSTSCVCCWRSSPDSCPWGIGFTGSLLIICRKGDVSLHIRE